MIRKVSSLQHRATILLDSAGPRSITILVNQDPVGEIYVIGVDTDFRTKGLGRALAITGLNYLVAKDLKHAMLYVDADNEVALNMYQSLGLN